ncbi:hypothetical protein GCM10010216_21660 [Streptomyces flaveolus]|nr:hypothetical protein GCM10010216_21660 [Streptomyces flaveolus]
MALFVTAGCARTGTGDLRSPRRAGTGPSTGAASPRSAHAASTATASCRARAPKESATPQMVILSYGNTSAGAMDPGRLSIGLSSAAGSGQPLTLDRPLGSGD